MASAREPAREPPPTPQTARPSTTGSPPPASGAELWDRLAGVAPMMLRALLADMSLVSFDGSLARLRCQPTVRGVAEKKLADLSKLMSSLCGSPVRAELVEAQSASIPRDGDPDAGEEAESAGGDGAAFEPDIDHPIVKKTIEIFNGRIVEVKPVRTKPLDD